MTRKSKGKASKERGMPFPIDFLLNEKFSAVFARFLEKVVGKVHILVTVGDKPAIEIIFEEPYIILDIKNPILAVEAGLEEMLKRRKQITFDSKRLAGFQKMGYKLKIRYRSWEHELNL